MGRRTSSGETLKRAWNIPGRQARHHEGGEFYMPLDEFPAALCDPNGYLLISTATEYLASPYFRIGLRLNLRRPVSRISGYVRMH
jgi:hypothetical protein